jgi:O-antigen ligase
MKRVARPHLLFARNSRVDAAWWPFRMRSLPSAPPAARLKERERRQPLTLGGLATIALLVGILFTGPLILGGARLWIELPILEAAAVLMLVQAIRIARRAEAPRLDLIDLTVVVFTIYAIARWLTSPTEYYSRIEVLNVIGYAAVFLTCRHGLVRRTHGLFILLLLIALGVFEIGFGYYLDAHLEWCPFGPVERMHQFYAPRWVGTYSCPNHYGAICYMAMAAALAWGAFSKLSWPVRIVLFYLAGVMLVGVIYSASRGSMLGACGVILALTLLGMRNGMVRWWIPTLGGLVLLGALVFVFSQSKVAQSRLNDAQEVISNGSLQTYIRIVLARDALRIAADHPLFGTGPATFVFIHPRYQDSKFSHRAVLAHDDYLNTLADYGAVGFGLAVLFVVLVTVRFLRRPRADSRWQDRVLLTAGFIAWGGLVLHSFVDFNMHIPANAFMIFALAGMGLRRFSTETGSPSAGVSLPRVPVAIAAALFSLAFGYVVARTGLGDLILEHAQAQAPDTPPSKSIEAAQQALAFDPHNVPALIFIGDEHRMLAAGHDDLEPRLQEGELAAEAYQRARQLNPLDDTITASLGLTYDIMYRYPEAYFCYADALAHQPYDGQFWFRLGNHFWQTGRLDKAEQAYEMGLRCPNGAAENVQPEQEIRPYLAARGIPLPEPGTDPLKPGPPVQPVTVP